MDLLTIFVAIAATTLGLFGKLIVSEIQDWLPTLARALVTRATRQLPIDQRERYKEEILAHLEEYPGRLAKLYQAVSFSFRARSLRNSLGLTLTRDMRSTPAWTDSWTEDDVEASNSSTEGPLGFFDIAYDLLDTMQIARLLSNINNQAGDPEIAEFLSNIDCIHSDGKRFYSYNQLVEMLTQYHNLISYNPYASETNRIRCVMQKLLKD